MRTADRAARDPAHPFTEPGAAGESLDDASAAEATETMLTPAATVMTETLTTGMAAEPQTEVVTTDERTSDETPDEAVMVTPTTTSRPRSQREQRQQRAVRTASGLALDSEAEAMADVEGLAEEVTLLRASIRRLARPDDETVEHVKVLAELRHQVEALCTALKTQQALDGNDEARAAELARVLDELGDHLGVPR